jgi:hypothetical protein
MWLEDEITALHMKVYLGTVWLFHTVLCVTTTTTTTTTTTIIIIIIIII